LKKVKTKRGKLRLPFFYAQPISSPVRATFKLEKTSKQKWYFVLHFITFACLSRGAGRRGGHKQARKNKQAVSLLVYGKYLIIARWLGVAVS